MGLKGVASGPGSQLSNPVTRAQGGSGQTTGAETFRGTFNVTDYGAKGDGRTVSGVVLTNGSAAVTSPNYTFVAADVGKVFGLLVNNTYQRNGTITAVSAGAATLSGANFGFGSTTAVITFGTDDTVAIQTAVTAAGQNFITNGSSPFNMSLGGVVVLNTAIYMVTASFNWLSGVSMRGQGMMKSVLYWCAVGPSTTPMFGPNGSGASPMYDCCFADFAVHMISYNVSSYNVNQKGFIIIYNIRSSYVRVLVYGSPATGIGNDYPAQSEMRHCVLINCGRSWTSAGGGGAGIGVGISAGWPASNGLTADYGGLTIDSCYAFGCGSHGIFIETEGAGAPASELYRITNNHIVTKSGGKGIGDCGTLGCIITGNHIYGVSGGLDGILSQKTAVINAAVSYKGRIADNFITGCQNGITWDATTQSSVHLCDYTINDNKVFLSTAAGINIVTNASIVLDTLQVTGNEVSLSGSAGILLTGAAGAQDVTISDNILKNNGTAAGAAKTLAGISIQTAIARLRIYNNDCFDNQDSQTQAYGLIVDTVAVTGANIQGNDFQNNLTGPINLTNGATLAGTIAYNNGYNTLQQTLSGTTAGTITYSMPDTSANNKLFTAVVTGYENNTLGNQTITFLVPFINTPVISTNNTGLTLSVTTTTLTITAPNVVTVYAGIIQVVGA